MIGIIKLSHWSPLGIAKNWIKLFVDTVWKWEVPFGNLVSNLNWSHWSIKWLQKCKIAKTHLKYFAFFGISPNQSLRAKP